MFQLILLMISGWLALSTLAVAQADMQETAVAPVAVLGAVSEGERSILKNRLDNLLSRRYRIISEKQYLEAEEAAFQSLDASQCTEENCIRKIQELLQVESLFILQIIKEGGLVQLSLTRVGLDSRRTADATCSNCSLEGLLERLEALVDEFAPSPSTLVASPSQVMAGSPFERLRRELEREQVVEVRGKVECGSLSIPQCRNLAILEARRLAVEKGTAILVDSITEVENLQITKDRVRSKTKGLIIKAEELEKGLVGESGYFYRLRATVKGQLPEEFRPIEKPHAPAVVSAQLESTRGQMEIRVSWTAVDNADSYIIYWSNEVGVTKGAEKRIAVNRSPYFLSGVAPGRGYHIIVTAVNDAGESPASSEGFAQVPAVRRAQGNFVRVPNNDFRNGMFLLAGALIMEIRALQTNDDAEELADQSRLVDSKKKYNGAKDKRQEAEQSELYAMGLTGWALYLFFRPPEFETAINGANPAYRQKYALGITPKTIKVRAQWKW